MTYDAATRRYVARRVEKGKTKSEIIRCLKRLFAREIFGVIVNPPGDIPTTPIATTSRSAFERGAFQPLVPA